MKAHELAEALLAGKRSATVYVQTTDQDGMPVLVAVDGIAIANSEVYGNAVVIELEE